MFSADAPAPEPSHFSTVAISMLHASCGASLREKMFDVSRRLSKSALLLQVGAGRSDSLAVGIENRDLIMVVAPAVKHQFVPAIAMCAGCHSSFSMKLTSIDPDQSESLR